MSRGSSSKKPSSSAQKTGQTTKDSSIKVALITMIGGIIVAIIAAISTILGPIISARIASNTTPTSTVKPSLVATQTTQDIYYQATSGIPVLNDQLNANDPKVNWYVYDNKDSACQFTNGAYQAIARLPDYKYICPALSTNFSNFAFLVQMKIVRGDCGGIFFRGNADSSVNQYYFFAVCQNGFYEFSRYDKPGGANVRFASNYSQAINTGPNQSNLIGVVAQHSHITLYVNNTFICDANDDKYTQGQIGVASAEYNNTTEVLFSNAKVWTLSS